MTTVQTDALGGRLPLVDPAELTDDQKGLFDLLSNTLVAWAKSVDVQSATDDGRLIGPFNPALYSPAISAKFIELQIRRFSPGRIRPAFKMVLLPNAIYLADALAHQSSRSCAFTPHREHGEVRPQQVSRKHPPPGERD